MNGTFGHLQQWTAGAWARASFGDQAYVSTPERALRVLEEAVELAQACDVPRDVIERTIERVYSKPKGEPAKELAQVGLTSLVMACNLGENFYGIVEEELNRVQAYAGVYWVNRHRDKVKAGVTLEQP